MALFVLDSEQLTVDTTSTGIPITSTILQKSATDTNKSAYLRAHFTVASGADGIFHTADPAITTLSASGGNGEVFEPPGAKFAITGSVDIGNWKAIRESAAGGDVLVQVVIEGTL